MKASQFISGLAFLMCIWAICQATHHVDKLPDGSVVTKTVENMPDGSTVTTKKIEHNGRISISTVTSYPERVLKNGKPRPIRTGPLDVCAKGSENIMCPKIKAFHHKCPANAKSIPIDETLKKVIEDAHNEARNDIAGGNQKLDSGARVCELKYCKILEKPATAHSNYCVFEHDKERETEEYSDPGQNLALLSSSAPIKEAEIPKIVKGLIHDFYYKELKLKGVTNDLFQQYRGGEWGHLAAGMVEGNCRVGCAVKLFEEGGWHKLMLTCDYALTVFEHKKVYEFGAPASKCTKPNKNEKYPNLCSVDEPYKWKF